MAKTLDITGDCCPMTFVKVKLTLAKMQSGEELDVALCEGEPLNNVSGVKIAIVDTAFETETDAQGKFTFTDLPAGDYVWRIQSDGGKAKERKVTVPSPSYDIEV